jgi:hypothetical protein
MRGDQARRASRSERHAALPIGVLRSLIWVHWTGGQVMAIEFACARCGRSFSVPAALAGKRAKCTACGTKQRIPKADAALGGRPAYDLAPAPVLPDEPAAPHPVSSGSSARRPTNRWIALVRPWALESSHVQGVAVLLVLLSIADLLMTFKLLRKSPAFFESNPVAQWFYARWNMTGMVIFKFSIIGGVIAVGELIERHRPGWGQFVLLVGSVGAAYAFYRGLSLYLGLS